MNQAVPLVCIPYNRLIPCVALIALTGFPICLHAQTSPSTQYDEALTLIRESQFTLAEKRIDALLTDNIDDHKAHMLRKALANALVRSNRQDRATEQFEKFLEYMVSGRKQSRPLLRHLPQILVNIPYLRENEEPKASLMLDRIIKVMSQAVADEPANVGYSSGLSTAVNFKARGLQNQGNYSEVEATYTAELDRLRARWRKAPDNPGDWLRLIYLLQTAASPKHPSYQTFATTLLLERRNLLRLAVNKFPDSADVVAEYVKEELAEIEKLRQQSPQQALVAVEELNRQFNSIYVRNSARRALLQTKLMLDKAQQKLSRKLNKESLTGSKLPPLEAVEWIDGSPQDLQFPQETVTIVLFISPNNERSVAELKKLSNESNKYPHGFKLVVVVNDYNQSFLRMTTTKKKEVVGFETNKRLFRQNLQSRIIKENDLQVSTCLAIDAGTIANRFGVDALPYIVVVDRNGICGQVQSGDIQHEELRSIVGELNKK